ncbi:HlyD family secretion protein [Hephaestia caeni]|uniref:HlyD family secretion protein n=1 Tax=Hephaestia caeni TaxID=645617 RepID=A0A397NLF2_9SPHN|nr:efflux RND transporter periplasmic adaptor subunit [Hephaestia caeni]RIA37208.1 HlyD family secretion protein [Hephaestia caeni]
MADQDISTPQSDEEFLGVKERPAWRGRVLWAALGLGAILLIVLAAHFLKKSDGPSYATQPVTRGALTTSVSATGKLAPVNQVTVGSQLSGLVTQVMVDVNDRVAKGQPLALIDPEQIDDQIRAGRAQLAASTASVAQARATLAQANATLARYQEVSRLSDGRVPAKTEMDAAIAERDRASGALKVAQANVASSEASLAQNQTQRQRAIIRSPVTGVVLARQVDPGQTVAASFNTPTLFVIAEDLSKMKLEVSVDEADVGQIKEGQRASFTVDAFPGKTFPAAITRVDLGSNLTVQDASSSTTSSTTSSAGQVVSYAADLSVSNPTLELRPGMTATADIITSEQKDALLVPNAALRFSPPAAATPAAKESGGITSALVPSRRRRTVGNGAGESLTNSGKATVYVKGDNGTPRPIQITIGKSNGSLTVVTGGDLKPGMEVIVGQLSGKEGVSGGGERRGNRSAARGG